MRTYTNTQIRRDTGGALDDAQHAPVMVTHGGEDSAVLISAYQWEIMKGRILSSYESQRRLNEERSAGEDPDMGISSSCSRLRYIPEASGGRLGPEVTSKARPCATGRR